MKKKTTKNDFICKRDDGLFSRKINKQILHLTQSIITLISDIKLRQIRLFTKQKLIVY
jgi:hypothetical protein